MSVTTTRKCRYIYIEYLKYSGVYSNTDTTSRRLVLPLKSGGASFAAAKRFNISCIGSLVRLFSGLLGRGKGGLLFGLALFRGCCLAASQQHVVGRVGGRAVVRPLREVSGLQVALKPVAVGIDVASIIHGPTVTKRQCSASREALQADSGLLCWLLLWSSSSPSQHVSWWSCGNEVSAAGDGGAAAFAPNRPPVLVWELPRFFFR